jgi:hypothetical protein
MPDFQQVGWLQAPAADERLLDGRLGVAGEERAESAVADEQHHGSVVDIALRKRARHVRR